MNASAVTEPLADAPAAQLRARLEKFLEQTPKVDATVFVHPDATVLGAVTLHAYASVWPQAVLRGDINSIKIGAGSNVQDGAVVHVADEFGVTIGRDVTIGHNAVVHACTIEDDCLIGMGAVVLDGAIVGAQSIIGAQALVPKGMRIPPGSLVMGTPARIIRALSSEERTSLREWALRYRIVAEAHRAKS